MQEQKDRYNIDELIKIFKRHTIKLEKNNKELIRSFTKNYPGEPIPAHLKDDFNLSRALLTFSREIKDLKKRLRRLKPHS
jgi:hypothetical protein